MCACELFIDKKSKRNCLSHCAKHQMRKLQTRSLLSQCHGFRFIFHFTTFIFSFVLQNCTILIKLLVSGIVLFWHNIFGIEFHNMFRQTKYMVCVKPTGLCTYREYWFVNRLLNDEQFDQPFRIVEIVTINIEVHFISLFTHRKWQRYGKWEYHIWHSFLSYRIFIYR